MSYERKFMSTRIFWRHTFAQPKMGPLDYRAIFVVFPFILYVRPFTIMILLGILVTMWVLQQRKIEPDNIVRWMRAKVAGDKRTAQGIRRLREPVDYGFETDEAVEREIRRQHNIRENRKSPKYKGRKFGDPTSLGANRRLPLRQRFTTVRSG